LLNLCKSIERDVIPLTGIIIVLKISIGFIDIAWDDENVPEDAILRKYRQNDKNYANLKKVPSGFSPAFVEIDGEINLCENFV
jgi:hypothetical protein